MLLPTVSEFCLAAVDTPGVVGARAGLRLAVLGPIVAAQALKVGACTAANVRVGAVRQEVRALDLPGGFTPATFTLGELQALCEQMLGERLDKSSFRRRLADRDLVEPVKGEMRTGANRPAQVFCLK
jgi:hypothetical protein